MKYCFCVTLFSLLVMVFSPIAAEEGLIVESQSKMSFMSMGGTTSTMKAYLAPHAAHMLSTTKPEGIMAYQPDLVPKGTNTIIHYDKRVGWNLDTLTKTYTEIDLALPMEPDTAGADTGLVSFSFPKDTAAGSYVWETTRDSTAAGENINGYLCRKYAIRTVGRSSVEEKDSCLVNTEFWVCDSVSGRDIYMAYEAFQMDTLNIGGGDDNSKDMDIMEVISRHAVEMMRRRLAIGGVTIKYQIAAQVAMFDMPSLDNMENPQMNSEISDSSEAELRNNMLNMMRSMFGDSEDMLDFMTVSFEVTGIESGDLDESLFVIPEGYSLKEETEME